MYCSKNCLVSLIIKVLLNKKKENTLLSYSGSNGFFSACEQKKETFLTRPPTSNVNDKNVKQTVGKQKNVKKRVLSQFFAVCPLNAWIAKNTQFLLVFPLCGEKFKVLTLFRHTNKFVPEKHSSIFGIRIPNAPEGCLGGCHSGWCKSIFCVMLARRASVLTTVSMKLRGFGCSPASWVPSLDKEFVVSRLWKNIPPQARPRTRTA